VQPAIPPLEVLPESNEIGSLLRKPTCTFKQAVKADDCGTPFTVRVEAIP
jgi:hypothetical protein